MASNWLSFFVSVCMSAACVGFSVQELHAQPEHASIKRAVTVDDAIRMTRLADPGYVGGAKAKPQVAHFSPDKKRFVVVLRKGNLENNTNEYSLFLFHTARSSRASSPQLLLTLASASNRPAIQNVTWLEDNDTVVFLGERPGDHQQLFTLSCGTRKLGKLTDHGTNVLGYSIASQGRYFAFVAEKPTQKIWTEKTQREGIRVTTQRIVDLIAGDDRKSLEDGEIFVKLPGSRIPKRLEIEAPLVSNGTFSLSPDGRYLTVMTRARNVPDNWNGYEDQELQRLLHMRLPNGVAPLILQYTLIDTLSGVHKPLIDAPIDPRLGSELAWSPDSRSLVVTGAYLPLDVDDAPERAARQNATFVVEIRIPSRETIKFPTSDLRLIRWDAKARKVLFQLGRRNALLGKDAPLVAYSSREGSWKEAEIQSAEDSLKVSLDEDLNTPPRIFVLDTKSGKRSLLFDLNPQLSNLSLVRVEHVHWKATDGHEVDGGLYLPQDYVPGKTYPLILQTHGFNPQRFWMDGPWTTAFAAQALANRGFVVLQVSDWPELSQIYKIIVTEAEGPYQMSSFEGAIDYLDARGLIDRDRVGIIGFSRSCFYVKFTLTHSKYKFAAASVTDGIDAGYFQYLQQANSLSTLESDRMNGSPPFGEGLSFWLKLSPGFNLHRVHTPVRIEALGPASLLFEWEWFAGLSRLGKPVNLIYQPDAAHILEKPWERLVSQQGNVDWFCFWLKGEEDPNPAKAEQYDRWRELRKQQEKASPTK